MSTGVPSRPALARRPCLRNLTGHREGTPSKRLNPRFHIHRFQAFLLAEVSSPLLSAEGPRPTICSRSRRRVGDELARALRLRAYEYQSDDGEHTGQRGNRTRSSAGWTVAFRRLRTHAPRLTSSGRRADCTGVRSRAPHGGRTRLTRCPKSTWRTTWTSTRSGSTAAPPTAPIRVHHRCNPLTDRPDGQPSNDV